MLDVAFQCVLRYIYQCVNWLLISTKRTVMVTYQLVGRLIFKGTRLENSHCSKSCSTLDGFFGREFHFLRRDIVKQEMVAINSECI